MIWHDKRRKNAVGDEWGAVPTVVMPSSSWVRQYLQYREIPNFEKLSVEGIMEITCTWQEYQRKLYDGSIDP